MDIFLLSNHSILNLLNSLLSLSFAIALFSKKDALPATRWLAAMFTGYFLLFLGYFLSYSIFHPLAAFHRIMTTNIIFGLLAFVGFVYRYPENDENLVPRKWIVGVGIVAATAWLQFSYSLFSLTPIFRFGAHIFNFDAGRFIAIVILSLMIWALAVIVRKWLRYRKLVRQTPTPQLQSYYKGSRGFTVALGFMVFVGLLNFLVHWGWISFNIYAFMFSYVTAIAFFYVFIVYITYSPEPTTFLVKIVSISGISVLTLLGLVSSVSLNQAEDAYDRTRRAEIEMARALLNKGDLAALPASLQYVLEKTDSETVLRHSALPSLELAQFKGTSFTREQAAGSGHSGSARDYRQAGNHFFTVYRQELPGRHLEFGFSYLAYRQEIHTVARQFALIILAAMALLLVVFPVFFRPSLIAPLKQLMAGVERIQQGDLSRDVPVQVEDEIGFLTRSFNRMQKTIGDARDNLEQKVADRTQDLEQAMQKLKEMDELKTNFFANISHELRTPLTLLLSPLESFLQGEFGELKNDQTSQIAAMHRNAHKLLKLINNLLDFSKLEAGRMETRFQRIDFGAYVRELVAAFDSAASSAGLTLSVRTPQTPLHASIDPEKMDKIVLNLLSNAFKFTPHGRIEVTVSGEDNHNVCLTVTDTGAGIPEDKLETIFERFSQVDGSASRRYEGTGIGLALARELAHLHNGTLVAQSAGADQGSTFTLTFPGDLEGRAEDKEEIEPLPSRRRVNRGSETGILADLNDRKEDRTFDDLSDRPLGATTATVLIVEDTHDMRKFLVFLLRNHFKLITARNGKEGYRKAQQHCPDLIVSDVMMPEWSGYQLLAAIRESEELRSTPVLLLTAKADVTMKIEGLDRGADDYIVKPFNSKELLSRIRSQLRMQSLQKEIRIMRDQLLELNEKLAGQVQLQVSELMLSGKFRNYLPPQLVQTILSRESDAVVKSERKELTIFFSDIINFTGITEDMDPERLAALLNEYLSEMTAIARKYNGTIDKFIGDAIMIHFGHHGGIMPQADARSCAQMAVDMQRRMRELSTVWLERGFSSPFQIRCGIHTGYVAVGNFGSEERLDYTVIGSNVNLASRIQAEAEPGGILCSHTTWAYLREAFPLTPAGELKAKGFYKTIPVYRLEL